MVCAGIVSFDPRALMVSDWQEVLRMRTRTQSLSQADSLLAAEKFTAITLPAALERDEEGAVAVS